MSKTGYRMNNLVCRKHRYICNNSETLKSKLIEVFIDSLIMLLQIYM